MPARKKLVAKINCQEDGNADIGSQEVGRIPITMDEVGGTTDEQENKQYRATDAGHVWWESRAVWYIRDALYKCGFAEAKVDKIDQDPTHVSAGFDEVDEPVEDCCTGVGDVEICQKAEAGACGSSEVRDTRLRAACENSGCVTDQRY